MDIAKLLVTELQADVMVKDRVGFTPLHAAAKNGHANIVSFLLTQPGIDPVSEKFSKFIGQMYSTSNKKIHSNHHPKVYIIHISSYFTNLVTIPYSRWSGQLYLKFVYKFMR